MNMSSSLRNMHFWVVSVLQKPGFNGDSLLLTKNIEHHLLFTKKCFNIKLYIFVTKNIQIGGISVPQKQGFDVGSFLHKWHAFGGASVFRRNNASILRNLPWKEFWKWLHCFEHVFPTCQERSVYFTSVCSSVLFFHGFNVVFIDFSMGMVFTDLLIEITDFYWDTGCHCS